MEQEEYPQAESFDSDIPNTPVGRDSTPELLKGLISNDEFSEHLKEDFDFMFNKDVTLSFQDENSKRNKLIDFDILKIDTQFSLPYHAYDFKLERRFNALKFILETKLERAKGFDSNKKINERIVQQTQFSENKSTRNSDGENSGNFLTRLLGRK